MQVGRFGSVNVYINPSVSGSAQLEININGFGLKAHIVRELMPLGRSTYLEQ